jgi:hypothetical protein
MGIFSFLAPSRPRKYFDSKVVAQDMERDGFAVIDFPEPEFDRLADDIWQSLQTYFDWEPWRNGTAGGVRVPDAWTVNESARRIATNAAIIDLLSGIYGRRAFAFQTLNFAVGTQQSIHADLVHFCARPVQFMCGVWVALEDISDEAGPLLYYPGSHKWPPLLPENVGAPMAAHESPYEHYHMLEKAWTAEIEERNAKPVRFTPRKGQALIWAANLLHGGAPQKNRALTRQSQVTHYFFEGCSYFTPLTGEARNPKPIEPPAASVGASN